MRAVTFFLAAVVLAAAARAQDPAASATLQNGNGARVDVLSIGAVIQRLLVPNASGQLADVVAGFDDPSLYQNNTYSPYFGCVVGRVANRIKGAAFQLEGQRYELDANNNGNQLHGGAQGWCVKTWNISKVESSLGDAVRLEYLSPDGDEGFPNAVEASVTYILTPDNALVVQFEATSDGPTPINMAQHSYFNLDGPGTNKTVLDHEVFINGSYITPTDDSLIPTGQFQAVQGTPYDFLTPTAIGERTYETNTQPLGYDINYVLFGLTGPEAKAATQDCIVSEDLGLAATVTSPSGRALDVLTQSPGLQFYTAINLNGSVIGKDGAAYPQYGAFALETQNFPNAINEPAFPQCTLLPGQTYAYTTIYRFYNVDDDESALPPAGASSL